MTDVNSQTTAELLDANGDLVSKRTTMLTQDEAELLRKYKKFLSAHGLREAIFCNACWSGDRHDGMKAFVTDGQILFECRCRTLFYQGQTF